MTDTPKLLWTPSPERVARTNMTAFKRAVGRNADDYGALHAWSVEQPEAFWTAVWDFVGVKGERGGRDFGGRDKGGRDKRDSGPSHRQWATSAGPRERDRAADPNSPFAKLAALKDQLAGNRKE